MKRSQGQVDKLGISHEYLYISRGDTVDNMVNNLKNSLILLVLLSIFHMNGFHFQLFSPDWRVMRQADLANDLYWSMQCKTIQLPLIYHVRLTIKASLQPVTDPDRSRTFAFVLPTKTLPCVRPFSGPDGYSYF